MGNNEASSTSYFSRELAVKEWNQRKVILADLQEAGQHE